MTEARADALAVDGIEAGYFRDVPILNGASLRVGRGEMVTIVGPNGAGKSTLVRVVIGLLEPWAGTVRVDGDDVTGRKPHVVVRRGVGYVAQRDNVFGTMTVWENLELGSLALRAGDAAERSAAMLELFPRLAERRSQPAGTLSGGERQMLALARALMADPALLILDEPSAGLSPVAVDLIFEKIGEINARGVTILMVEQNARRALAMSHRGYVLDGGQNRFEGTGPGPPARPEGRRPVPRRRGRGLAAEHEERSADARLEAEVLRDLRRPQAVDEPHDDREVVDVVEHEDRVGERRGLPRQEEVVVERRDEAGACVLRLAQDRAELVRRGLPLVRGRAVPAVGRRHEHEDAVGRIEVGLGVLHGRTSVPGVCEILKPPSTCCTVARLRHTARTRRQEAS